MITYENTVDNPSSDLLFDRPISVVGMLTTEELLECRRVDQNLRMVVERATRLGGKGFNVAAGLAAQRCPTRLFAEVGGAVPAESFPDLMDDKFCFQVLDENDKVWALIENGIEDQLCVRLGERTSSIPDYKAALEETAIDSKFLYVSAAPIEMLHAVVEASNVFDQIFLNPCIPLFSIVGGAESELVYELVDVADVLLMNMLEFETLAGHPAIAGRPAQLWDLDPSKSLVVTDGANGCLYGGNKGWVRQEVVETVTDVRLDVGAGDTFAAGFMASYLKSGELALACRSGMELASLKIGLFSSHLDYS